MTSLEYYIEQIEQFVSALTDDIESGEGTVVTQTKLAVYREVLEHLEEIEQEPSYNSINPELNGELISRQEVLNKILKFSVTDGRSVSVIGLWTEVNDLPSVTPQEPCKDVAKERYEDLCEYFGGAKDILKNREDFKAWLGRVKWHIHKAEELSEENDDLRDQLAMRDRFKHEPCNDAISREDVEECKELMTDINGDTVYAVRMSDIRRLSPVTSKTGHWITDAKTYYEELNKRGLGVDEYTPYFTDDIACSECLAKYSMLDNETEFFKHCPNCGAKMEG